MPVQTVPVPGGRLHVVDEGDPTGPAILLLHAGIADLAPNARAAILPDVAHMIGMEAPDRLAAIILEFLAPGRPGS